MPRFLLKRLAFGLVMLIAINGLGYVYAHQARLWQAERNPYFTRVESGPLVSDYAAYVRQLLRFDPGQLPNRQSVAEAIGHAAGASLGLLSLALLLSAGLGLGLGLLAVRSHPPDVAPWLTALTTVGLATPSFYVGSLFITGTVFYMVRTDLNFHLPIQGFGWDTHLLFPLGALALRPTVQIALVTAQLLAQALREQYILVARSLGHSWRSIRWRLALRNILAPVVLTLAGSFRLLLSELILIEWLFNWPGLGRMFAQTLMPPLTSSVAGALSPFYLNPPLVAALLTVSAALFIGGDLVATVAVHKLDPRLQAGEEKGPHA